MAMKFIEAVDKVTSEYGLDLSGDSEDSWRGFYVKIGDETRRVEVQDIEVDADGDVVIEVAG